MQCCSYTIAYQAQIHTYVNFFTARITPVCNTNGVLSTYTNSDTVQQFRCKVHLTTVYLPLFFASSPASLGFSPPVECSTASTKTCQEGTSYSPVYPFCSHSCSIVRSLSLRFICSWIPFNV